MAGCHHCDGAFDGASAAYRRILWIVIAINATMFLVELSAGLAADSMALQADALDFIGDTATYALSLWVIAKPLRMRASAALFKGISLGALGLWVIAATGYRLVIVGAPEPLVMGGVGLLALAANSVSALLLLRFRDGDANVRSVWLCSRNDAIGNIAVVIAALAVGGSGTPWPDLLVAAAMAVLFLNSALRIIRQATAELRTAAPARAT